MPSDCSSTKLSMDCVVQFAAAAGFNKNKQMLATAAAIAYAESSGRINALSATGCCKGLWQINTEVHPYTDAQMRDPEQNARAAWSISKQGTDWKAWDVYLNGMYLMYMPTATIAAGKVTTTDSGGSRDLFPEGTPADTALESAASIGDAVQYLEMTREWLSDRNNIMRIAKVTMGAALLIAGVVMVMRPVLENTVSGAVGMVAKGLKK